MAKIVKKLCNKIIITDDNPREEDPKKITKEIFDFTKKGKIINNRKIAIKEGINITNRNELLLIAGKGHETYQIFKNKKNYFSDFREVKKNI